MSKLPVNRVVRTTVNLAPSAAQAQSLSDLLLLGTSTIIDPVERSRTYSSLTAVATDFGTTAQEYFGAQAWFDQSPQPTQIIVGRWVNAASRGGLRCASLPASGQVIADWNAVTAGSFKVAKNGAALADITGMNFSGAANLNAVAAIIQTALTGTTVVWNSTYERFEIESTVAPGATSAISFLQAAATGTDISLMMAGRSTSSGAYVYVGMAAETAAASVALFDNTMGQQWYGLVIPSAVDADHSAVGLFIEGASNKHYYGVNTQSAGVLVPATTSDIASVLKALGLKRTMVQYSSESLYAVCSALGRILTTNYDSANTVITLKFKNEPGIVAEELSTTQADAAEAKNANLFVAYDNDTAILEEGVSCDGTFIDVVMGTDWLALDIQNRLFNLLYTSTTKIPQTDAGVQLMVTTIEASCAQGVLNGLLAPGVWNADGFGQLHEGDFLQKGYYVYVVPIAQQNPTDRAARRAPPFKIAAKLAGAIHSADAEIVVNQ